MSDLKVDGITAATANTAVTIKGAGTGKVVLGDGELIWPDADGSANQYIKTDGSKNLAFATLPTAGFTLAAEQATASGQSVTFGSIPTGTKVIKIMLEAFSTNGAATCKLTIGDAGGLETSGYISQSSYVPAGTPAMVTATDSFAIDVYNSATVSNGIIELALKDAANFTWVSIHTLIDAGRGENFYGGGVKSLTAELTQLQFSTTDTFDAGSISVMYF